MMGGFVVTNQCSWCFSMFARIIGRSLEGTFQRVAELGWTAQRSEAEEGIY